MRASARMFCPAPPGQDRSIMTHATALCASISIEETGDVAPEWVHLLPAGEVRTQDGRGPYQAGDITALMAASLPAGAKLVLDENHATDLAAPQGREAPARGWIVELQSRADGIWGRVAWTAEAIRRAVWKEYRGISPVIAHRASGAITSILRASLTNTPNLQGLVTLHSEGNDMDLRNALIEATGLGSGADDGAIVTAVKEAIANKGGDAAVALQSALAPIAKAAGLAETSDAATVLAGVQQLATSGDAATITALQSEIATLGTRLQAVTDAGLRKDATTFVDGAIAEGRVAVKPMRDRYIAMHMKDPAGTEELIKAMPKLTGVTITGDAPEPKAGELTASQRNVVALMGLDPEDYKKTLAASGQGVEAL